MKILLTGLPRSGKTTLLQRLIEPIKDKVGFLTAEIKKNGERTGFKAISDSGKEATLADVQSSSPLRVSKYGVELEEFEKFLSGLRDFKPGELLYIDEIAQMELFSDRFKELVTRYLKADNHFVGTISKAHLDAFIEGVKKMEGVEIIEVTPENRDKLLEELRDKLPKS